MKKFTNLKLMLFVVGLTVILTIIVVYAWEKILMSPVYTALGAPPPAEEGHLHQWTIAQRIEHFFISITVDTIVVSLLLWMVNTEQRKLRASEERYRALFEQASDGIGVVTATNHTLVDANDRFAEIMGYEASNVIGSHVCDLFAGNGNCSVTGWPLGLSDCAEPHDLSPDAPANVGPIELNVETVAGNRLPLSITCSALTTGKEKLFILNIHDLTEHKELEKQKEDMRSRLAQNERINALGRMAAQVAHEVKNPLAGMRLYSLHLKSKVGNKVDEKEMSLIDKVIAGINHLTEIVEKVLSFTRPITLTRNPVSLDQILIEAVNLLEPQMTTAKVELKLDMSEALPHAMLDEALIRATLINLMINSIQAMPDGGNLTITTRGDQNNIVLTIADTGVGMTDEQVEHVFEPFYTTKSQGMGLGMSQAWKVIQEHKGAVQIESHVGKGTRITITLPVEE